MKILHINTVDTGGAATACLRIHLALLEKGIDSKVLLLGKNREIPETYLFEPTIPPVSKMQRLRKKLTKLSPLAKRRARQQQRQLADLNARQQGAEIFSFPTSPYDITQSPLYQEADIIQLNWVSGFLDEPSFFAKNTKPVIWRMADLYTCGGGYHYEKGFPFDALRPELEINHALRLATLKGKKLHMVPISNWVKRKAEESEILGPLNKTMINNGLDRTLFKPHDKAFARSVFNLPQGKKILLFGAANVKNKRKGFDLLKKALYTLEEDVVLVVFGRDALDPTEFMFPLIQLARIADKRLLSVLYAAADYFVMPSIEEAFGQVSIEALACGTPIVSFPTGGSLDIVREELNGTLAADFTSQGFAAALKRALATDFDKEALLADVKERFDIADKADEYIELYARLLAEHRHRVPSALI
ncbi:glycosyltransferase [Olivibacter sitiensis]|uniref:glycosyltransferase n=1 Tax=Olivibacter sitiensis TaxID=376470 RepID=UPI00040FF66D|nr:glycosyltransferase [Olivibacter sitiensis]